MDFEAWYKARAREAATVIVMVLFAAFVAILHRVAPHGSLYLFLADLFHQILFYIGGVLALVEMVTLKWLHTPLEKKLFTGLTLLCLFISCFQAWVDEHHNAEELIKDKADIVGQREFWKGQSYAKDEAIRMRDGLLDQNFTTLSGTQSSLAQLSNKILDVTKPEARVITPFLVIKNGNLERYLLLVNKTITPVHMIAKCDKPIVSGVGSILGSKTTILGDSWPGPRSNGRYAVGSGGNVWGPTAPLIVTLNFNELSDHQCSFEEQ